MSQDLSNKKILVRVIVNSGGLAFAVAIANLEELKEKIYDITGFTPNKYYLLIDNATILEDNDYLQIMKEAAWSQSLMQIYLVEGTLLSSNLEGGNNLEAQNAKISKSEDSYLEFEKKSMAYILKRVKIDPSFLTPDIIPSLWRFAEENDEKEIRNFCVNQLLSDPLLVFKDSLQSLDLSQWRTILQSELINCTEYELAHALCSWFNFLKNVSAQKEKLELFSYLRLGTYSYKALEDHLSTMVPKLPERVLFPFIRYYTLRDEKFKSENPKLFEMRTLQKERFQPDQISSRVVDIIPSAKGIHYTLKMSSLYPGLPNSYESLTSGNWNYPGAATNYGGAQYIDAVYSSCVRVSAITLSSPSQGDFASQGWGNGYIPQITLQYSADGIEFQTIRSLSGISEQPGPLTFEFAPVVALVVRLRSESSYVATGSFIVE